MRFLEALHGALEAPRLRRCPARRATGALELFAQPQLQLAGGLLGEGHRDDLLDRRRVPVSISRTMRLTSSVVLPVPAAASTTSVASSASAMRWRSSAIGAARGRGHGILRSASRSAQRPACARVRRSSSRPHTGRKSHHSQRVASTRPGRAASGPCSTARSMISSTSRPRRRDVSSSGIGVLAEVAGRRAVPQPALVDRLAGERLERQRRRAPAAARGRRRRRWRASCGCCPVLWSVTRSAPCRRRCRSTRSIEPRSWKPCRRRRAGVAHRRRIAAGVVRQAERELEALAAPSARRRAAAARARAAGRAASTPISSRPHAVDGRREVVVGLRRSTVADRPFELLPRRGRSRLR